MKGDVMMSFCCVDLCYFHLLDHQVYYYLALREWGGGSFV